MNRWPSAKSSLPEGFVIILTMLALLAPGCALEVGTEPEEVAQASSALVNGYVVDDAGNPGVVAVYHDYIRPCSGTLIRNSWVVTALHCLTTDGDVDSPLLAPSKVKVVRAANPGLTAPAHASTALALYKHPTQDLALIKISPQIIKPVALWNGDWSAVGGRNAIAFGYGRSVAGGNVDVEDGTSGAGRLRAATLAIDTSDVGFLFDLPANANNQYLWHGDSGGPSMLHDTFARLQLQIAGVHITGSEEYGTDVNVAAYRQWIKRTQRNRGDLDGDGKADIALIGAAGWTNVPVALSTGANSFTAGTFTAQSIPGWAAVAGATPLAGDYNGDGRSDIALTGVSGWNTIPVGFSVTSNGTHGFFPTNSTVSQFPGWASQAGVKLLAGDLDGDGRDDIIALGGPGWSTIRSAWSNGAGTFSPHASNVLTDFSNWSRVANVKALAGDFDGDGRDDIVLTGGSGWGSLPVAFSNGDGGFHVTNATVASFPALAATAGVKVVVGDFSGDGRDDIALTGGAGWTKIPIAFSNGNGTFTVTNQTVSSFPAWSRVAGAKLVAGDFNGDWKDDLALTGGSSWSTIPIALSTGGGNFNVVNSASSIFPAQAAQAGVKALSGHRAL